ncbi:hypothetical protein [Streptomyces sp. NPDC058657]|uniref:hypothetical protein n=1 Tax=unclassified Streptomyces TaxID=2593676 RepID=UPI00364C92FA
MTTPLPQVRLDQFARRIPLIPRSHLVYPTFTARIDEVANCAEKSTQDRPLPERINLACAAWNLSALVASDCGLPDLARDLCLRQLRIFQTALPLTGDTAIAGLQPIINLVRLTARAEDPQTAYHQLMSVRRALHQGGSFTIHGHPFHSAGFATEATLEHIQPWLHSLLLDDGTRLLAASGQWNRAAQHATVYDEAPARLHTSRQAAVIANLHTTGDPVTVHSLLDRATITEPWERAVEKILRHYADHRTNRATPEGFATAARAVQDALEPGPPNLRMFRVRLALAAISLMPKDHEAWGQPLYNAIVSDTVGSGDAHAAREILRQPVDLASKWSDRELRATVRSGHLGQGALPEPVLSTLEQAARTAGASLIHCLSQKGATSPPLRQARVN